MLVRSKETEAFVTNLQIWQSISTQNILHAGGLAEQGYVRSCVRPLKSEGLASAGNHRRNDTSCSNETVAVRWIGERADRRSVGSTTEVVSSSDSKASISGIEGTFVCTCVDSQVTEIMSGKLHTGPDVVLD